MLEMNSTSSGIHTSSQLHVIALFKKIIHNNDDDCLHFLHLLVAVGSLGGLKVLTSEDLFIAFIFSLSALPSIVWKQIIVVRGLFYEFIEIA